MNAPSSPTIAAAPGAPPDDAPIVFFDGVCGLCNRTVDFILSHDRRQRIRVAPLQGETASRELDSSDTAQLGSVVLKTSRGTYRRSSAAVRILTELGGVWRVLGGLLWLVPKPLRDVGYEAVARNRYRLFGRKESCRLPTPEEAGRLLP
ncbi:MAG: DUF393 domain-containing protein [Planctomyces sp.]|nr:DUF393 domain-containing protein [Planctomyces sp.]